jgi:hypothetical protein
VDGVNPPESPKDESDKFPALADSVAISGRDHESAKDKEEVDEQIAPDRSCEHTRPGEIQMKDRNAQGAEAAPAIQHDEAISLRDRGNGCSRNFVTTQKQSPAKSRDVSIPVESLLQREGGSISFPEPRRDRSDPSPGSRYRRGSTGLRPRDRPRPGAGRDRAPRRSARQGRRFPV